MVTRVTLTLEQPEYAALLRAGEAELRNPQDQARFILRKELERLGFLEMPKVTQTKRKEAINE
jgi:hypothetical protein